MKNNSAKPALSVPLKAIHQDYLVIAEKHPAHAENGIKRVEAVLEGNERTVAFLGSNAEATQRVACALLSCDPPAVARKKALRYVAVSNSAECPWKPISCEHFANLKANYVELKLTPTGADAPVSGPIVEETEETVTLKVGDSNQVFDKREVITQVTQGKIVDLEGNEIVCSVAPESLDTDGALSLDAGEIVLNVDGTVVKMDPLDIRSWQRAAEGKRRVEPSYEAVFSPDEDEADVAPVDIPFDNALLRDRRAILVMPSLGVDGWPYVRNAEALCVVLDGPVRAKEETFLTQIRPFTPNIFFVQDNFEDTAKGREVRRKNVRALAACLDQSPTDINDRYFPVNSHLKRLSMSCEHPQEALSKSRFPRLLQWFESLDRIEAKKHRDRRALGQIRNEAQTLIATLRWHHDNSSWSAALLESFQKDFPQKHDDIQLQTTSEIKQMFGSYRIHPPVAEFMKEFGVSNMKLKELKDENDKLLAKFVDWNTSRLGDIFENHFKNLSELPQQLVKAAPPPPSTAAATFSRPFDATVVEYAVQKVWTELFLNIQNEHELRVSTPQGSSFAQFLQSLMFPGAIMAGPYMQGAGIVGKSGAGIVITSGAGIVGTAPPSTSLISTAAVFAAANPAIIVGAILLSIAAAVYFLNRRNRRKLQKEQLEKNLEDYLVNLSNHMCDASLQELARVKKTYNEVIRETLTPALELDAKQLNADIQYIDRLLDNISRALSQVK